MTILFYSEFVQNLIFLTLHYSTNVKKCNSFKDRCFSALKSKKKSTVLFTVNEKQSEPVFEVQLKDTTVKKGDDIHLKCKISGNPKPEVCLCT